MSHIPRNRIGRTLASRLVIPVAEVVADVTTAIWDAAQRLTQRRIAWMTAILLALVSVTCAMIYLTSSASHGPAQNIVLSSMLDLGTRTAEATLSDQPLSGQPAQSEAFQLSSHELQPASLTSAAHALDVTESAIGDLSDKSWNPDNSAKWVVKLAAFQSEPQAEHAHRQFEARGHRVWYVKSVVGEITWYRLYMGIYETPWSAQSDFEKLRRAIPWLVGCQVLPHEFDPTLVGVPTH